MTHRFGMVFTDWEWEELEHRRRDRGCRSISELLRADLFPVVPVGQVAAVILHGGPERR